MKHADFVVAVVTALSFGILVVVIASAALAESRTKATNDAAAVRAVDDLLDCALFGDESTTCEREEGRVQGTANAR